MVMAVREISAGRWWGEKRREEKRRDEERIIEETLRFLRCVCGWMLRKPGAP
jgi:hypothetical protein